MMKNRMATEVDSACGAILEELRRQGELDNTIIIFTTDNGNFHSEHGLAGKWYHIRRVFELH
jgi:arylsulfatase